MIRINWLNCTICTAMGWVLLVTVATGASNYMYTIADLGTLPNRTGERLIPYAINESGQVVGISDMGDDEGLNRAFYWDAQNGMQLIGGQSCSQAYSINESGTVAGMWAPGWFRGYKWSALSGFVDLGTAAGGPYSAIGGVNDNGYMVQNDWSFWGGPGSAFLRSPSGTLSRLPLISGYSWTEGSGINNSNQICGVVHNDAGTQGPAFFWDPQSGIHILDTFGGGRDMTRALNESGVVVGHSRDSAGKILPVMWDPVNGMSALAVLNPSEARGDAYGINDLNFIVGTSYSRPDVNLACLWLPDGGVLDLNNCLVNGSDWQFLTEARAINNGGLIVGTGLLTNGDWHAFVLTPIPEPATVLLIGLGTLAMARKRK